MLDLAALASAPAWALALLACVAGLTAPPLVASARSLWTRAVDASLVRRGYALTSLLSDVGQVAGPVLAGLLFVLAAWAPLLICSVGTIVAAALIVSGPGAPSTHALPQPMPKLRESRGFVGLLVVSILFGCALGLVQVAVPTLAGRWHEAWLAGLLLAAFAIGSVAGALWFGGRDWHRPVLERYLIAVLIFGVLLAPVALATGPATLVPLLVLAGLAVGPAAGLDLREPRRARAGRRRRGVHVGDDSRGRRLVGRQRRRSTARDPRRRRVAVRPRLRDPRRAGRARAPGLPAPPPGEQVTSRH